MIHVFPAAFSQAMLSPQMARTLLRLLLAAALGGAIGLEREMKRRPAGLRTNMFICFGAALFTVLSAELAGEFTGDHTRIAAQIIPGIGFIGAGSILHAKNGVSGLTTAATIFVVASIGMAAGAGLYSLSIFATSIILLALLMLGWLEGRFNLKPLVMNYTVMTDSATEDVLSDVNACLEEFGLKMQDMRMIKAGATSELVFGVSGTHQLQTRLMDRLRQCASLRNVAAQRSYEHE